MAAPITAIADATGASGQGALGAVLGVLRNIVHSALLVIDESTAHKENNDAHHHQHHQY